MIFVAADTSLFDDLIKTRNNHLYIVVLKFFTFQIDITLLLFIE